MRNGRKKFQRFSLEPRWNVIVAVTLAEYYCSNKNRRTGVRITNVIKRVITNTADRDTPIIEFKESSVAFDSATGFRRKELPPDCRTSDSPNIRLSSAALYISRFHWRRRG